MIEGYVLTILVVCFFVYLIFFMKGDKPSKPNTKSDESFETIRQLKDEELFDPITGRVITIEEAESGNWDVYNDSGVIPEDVIRKNYYPSEHNELFIKNFLFENGFKLSEPSTECAELWDALKIFGDSLNWSYDWYVTKESIKISHVYIESKSSQSYDSSTQNFPFANEAMLIDIVLPFECGNYVLRKTNFIEKYFSEVNETNDLVLDGFTCFEFGRSHKVGVMQAILKEIPVTDKLIIEFIGNHLILAYDTIMPIEDFKLLYDFLVIKR